MVHMIFQRFGAPLPKPVLAVERALLRALRSYEPQVYPGSLVLFRAGNHSAHMIAPDLGWGALTTKDVETLEVPGDHGSMYAEPHVQVLAQKLKPKLSESQIAAVNAGTY